jgi:hypothetical protein
MIMKGRAGWQLGAIRSGAKLTEQAVQLIRDQYRAGGWTCRSLAHQYGISHGQVSRIVSGKAWRDVDGGVGSGAVVGGTMAEPVDLDELERLLGAATPGPWHREGDAIAETDNYEIGIIAYAPDANLVVAAANALPALIARVREAEHRIEQWQRRVREQDRAMDTLLAARDYYKGEWEKGQDDLAALRAAAQKVAAAAVVVPDAPGKPWCQVCGRWIDVHGEHGCSLAALAALVPQEGA